MPDTVLLTLFDRIHPVEWTLVAVMPMSAVRGE